MRLSRTAITGAGRQNTFFLVVFGLSLYWGAMCSFKFNIFQEIQGMPDALLRADITSVVGSAGLFLALFLAGIFPSLLINRNSRNVIKALPFLLCTVSGVLAAVQQSDLYVPYWLLLVGRFFANLGLGSALIQVLPCVARSNPRNASLILVIAFFCGVLISLCLSNLDALASIFTTVFLVWACATTAALLPYEDIMEKTFSISMQAPEEEILEEKNGSSTKIKVQPVSRTAAAPQGLKGLEKEFWAQSCGMLLAGILFSMAIPLIPIISLHYGFDLPVLIILLLAGTAALIFVLATRNKVNLKLTQWGLFIPMIISLLSLLVFGQIWSLLFYAILITTFTFYDLINFIILSDFKRGQDWFSVVRVYCLGRSASVFGMLLGRLFIMPLSDGTVYDETSIRYLIFAVTAIMVVVVAFLAQSSVYGNRQRKEREVLERGRWMRACDAISEEHGLSVRERDVLVLLCRGRNAEFIAQSYYISISTVKTHIYRIYHKLSIHNQQELVSLVEEKVQAALDEQKDPSS